MHTNKCTTNTVQNMKMSWHNWCRLCAKEDPVGNFNVFCKSEHSAIDTTLATAIGKYFWINIKNGDPLSQYICPECHKLITELIAFSELVNKVQTMFCVLQNANANPQEVREQYGLRDEDRQHIMSISKSVATTAESDTFMKLSASVDEEEENEDEEHDAKQSHLIEMVDDMDEEEEETDVEADAEADLHVSKEVFELTDIEFELNEELKGQATSLSEIHTSKQASQRKQNKAVKIEKDETMQDEVLTDELDKIEQYVEAAAEALTEDEKSADDVDDSDLFRELKFKVEEDEASNREFIANEEEEELEQQQVQIADAKIECEDAAAASTNNKRKRVRTARYAKDGVRKVSIKRAKRSNDADSVYAAIDYKYTCKLCDKKYKNPTPYRRHMLEDHATEPDLPDFACETCAKIFPTERQLEMHSRVHLPLAEKLQIPCPFCEKKFSKDSVMRQHVNGVHKNEKPFICDECGRGLKTMAALNEHKLVHTNECPYECEVCQKGFKNKARLKVHLDTHTETNYICPTCGMQLNTRRTLKMHMLVHTDDKQFKCGFCEASFKRTKALKNHLILHTGLRPYKCNFCGKTFSNGSNCRSHKKKTHPEELAAEEAQGKKAEPASVPKLEELRSVGNIENPRKVNRFPGGLPPRMRALLIAAEQRSKGKKYLKQTRPNSTTTITDGIIAIDDTDATNSSAVPFTIEIQKCDEQNVETDVANGVGDEDDDDEETVIYEIIDEI